MQHDINYVHLFLLCFIFLFLHSDSFLHEIEVDTPTPIVFSTFYVNYSKQYKYVLSSSIPSNCKKRQYYLSAMQYRAQILMISFLRFADLKILAQLCFLLDDNLALLICELLQLPLHLRDLLLVLELV